MLFSLILLAADSTAKGPGLQPAPSFIDQFGGMFLIGGIFVVFYFFMIRPQQKKQKEEVTFRTGLQKGQKVMTIGGIHGKITSVEDNVIYVEVDNGVKLKMDRGAVKAPPAYEAEKS